MSEVSGECMSMLCRTYENKRLWRQVRSCLASEVEGRGNNREARRCDESNEVRWDGSVEHDEEHACPSFMFLLAPI